MRIQVSSHPCEDQTKGIYCILNTVNGKRYVGQTLESFKERWRKHKYRLRKGTHANRHLQSSWRKHGSQAFEFIILEKVADPTKITLKEQYWADQYNTFDRTQGYNKGTVVESTKGYRHTTQARAKMSISHKGQTPWNKGKTGCFKHTKEWKANQSERMCGQRIGEKSATALLIWNDVKEIRKRYINKTHTQSQLARMYNVSRGCIVGIVYNKTWRDKTYIYKPKREPRAKKINAVIAKEIKRLYCETHTTYVKLGKEFNINPSTVGDIVNNKTWTHA